MKIRSYIVLFIALYSCNREPKIEFLVAQNKEISMNNKTEFIFINKSNVNQLLFINNKSIVNSNGDYSIYYKLYDENFNEIENKTNTIIDSEFLLSEE